jgi:hypothetical protein
LPNHRAVDLRQDGPNATAYRSQPVEIPARYSVDAELIRAERDHRVRVLGPVERVGPYDRDGAIRYYDRSVEL